MYAESKLVLSIILPSFTMLASIPYIGICVSLQLKNVFTILLRNYNIISYVITNYVTVSG